MLTHCLQAARYDCLCWAGLLDSLLLAGCWHMQTKGLKVRTSAWVCNAWAEQSHNACERSTGTLAMPARDCRSKRGSLVSCIASAQPAPDLAHHLLVLHNIHPLHTSSGQVAQACTIMTSPAVWARH